VRIIRGCEAFKETNFTRVFLFIIYDVCVATASTLIKYSYVRVLKSFSTFT
jgi:hypothetical protein